MSIKVTIDDIKERFNNFNCDLITKEYLGSKRKYEFICRKHKDKGIQTTFIRNLGRGLCCHYCSSENNQRLRQVSENELKRIAEEKGFIFVRSELINKKRHIIYKCKKHLECGEQKMLVGNMRKSKGYCPYCLNKYRTHNDFVNEINNINPNIEILNKFINTDTIIQCRCKICKNEWHNCARNLLHGQGCRKCYNKKRAEDSKHSQEWFHEKMYKLHPNIKVLSKYNGMKTHVLCKCIIDNNEWKTTPDSLINNGTGCPICSNKANGERCRKSNKEFLSQLNEMNPYILPLENYKTDHKKILCRCLIHNYDWYVTPNKILHRRTGCPKCAAYHNENIIANILDKWGFKYVMQKRFPDCKDSYSLPFDFYIENHRIAIEYDGEHHYVPIFKTKYLHAENVDRIKYVRKHDRIKTEYCKKNNIYLIRIPYWDNDDIEYILFDNFVKAKAIKEI